MDLLDAQVVLRDYHRRTGASHYHSSASVLPVLFKIKAMMRPMDVCILSKAHAITAYLLVFETLPEKAPVQNEFGSLGSALPFALGVAKMKPESTVYVVVGDGEMQEGSNLEALAAIGRLGIKNIQVHIDWNGMQGMGLVTESSYVPVFRHPTYKGPSWECHYWSPK